MMKHEQWQHRFYITWGMAMACFFLLQADLVLLQKVNGFQVSVSFHRYYRRWSSPLPASPFPSPRSGYSYHGEALALYSKFEESDEDNLSSSSKNNQPLDNNKNDIDKDNNNINNNNNGRRSFMESPIDDERRPTRPYIPPLTQKNDNFWTDWGIETYDPPPRFPGTVDSVTDAAFDAIAGTIYGKQRLNPNSASNAMTTTLYGYRPVRTERDAGRIGIEIDGAATLFTTDSKRRRRTITTTTRKHTGSTIHESMTTTTTLSDFTALRHVALVLASKLAQGHWKGYEEPTSRNTNTKKGTKKSVGKDDQDDKGPQGRPVAVYFNTVRQALVASQELQLLKRTALENGDNDTARLYEECISIICLSQDHEIPQTMRRPKQQYKKLSTGKVVATRGIILVVQPTDFNTEFRPPGPAVDAISSLQKLVARAAVEELPTILLSPRFLVQSGYPGQDQSLYQQSSTYGGIEPPRGPTPWLMRDFSPPVFCWIGNALALSPHQMNEPPQHHSHNDDDDDDDDAAPQSSSSLPTQQQQQQCHFTKVALTQSVMHQDHPWHMFAVKECLASTKRSRSTSSYNGDEEETYEVSTSHEYLASTKTSSGRPTKNVIRQIMGEWSSS